MNELENYHKKGLTIRQTLNKVADKLEWQPQDDSPYDRPQSYWDLCDGLDRLRRKKPPIEQDYDFLEYVIEYAKNGKIIGIGYSSIENSYPDIIPAHEWRFLKIDFESGTATCDKKEYKDCRFILLDEFISLNKLTTNEIEQLKLIFDQKPTLEPEFTAKQTLGKEQANIREPRKRQDNLKKAINAAITKMGKRPSFAELWQYFQDDKDDTGFIDDFKETHITWRDTKGKFHDIPKNTFANRLSRIKM
ncbi:MAG: hypothetical protein Q7T96_03540 [Methylobacter sp.]|nr:hypothetical protein [Methylobacter sp.]